MSIDQGKYICAYTDFGFKRLFGSELNKDFLISFLNSFLNLKDKIVDLSYLSLEQLGDLVTDRDAIFDVYCKTSDDAYIIVEMQNAAQNYFKDRSIFYSSFATRNQAPKGVLDYQLKAVYTIGILNFVLEKTVSLIDMKSFYTTRSQIANFMTNWLTIILNYLNLPKQKMNLKLSKINGCMQ